MPEGQPGRGDCEHGDRERGRGDWVGPWREMARPSRRTHGPTRPALRSAVWGRASINHVGTFWGKGSSKRLRESTGGGGGRGTSVWTSIFFFASVYIHAF